MNKTTLAWLGTTLCMSTATFAQQDISQKDAPAYGDNPNLIKVLAVKAQDKIQTAAEKVGAVTERGVANIKPSVDQAWQNTKEYTTEQAVIARDNTRQGIDTAVQKVKQTKENLRGTGGVPIERGSMSQSSTTPQTTQPTQPSSSYTSSPVSPHVIEPTISSTQTVTTGAPSSLASVNNQNNIEFSESEIKRQSIPLQNSAQTPVNVETPAGSPNSTTSSPANNDESGVPR